MEASERARGRAVRGIEAATLVLRHAVEAYAVAGGEGAERLAAGLGNARGLERLAGRGLEAAQAALGTAAAGRRTALLASGDGVLAALPALREMVRLGLPVLVVVPSHGPEGGTTLPTPGCEDVAHLTALPAGLLVAADAGQVAEFLLAAQRAAIERAAPWIVAFDLASVGLTLANATLPEPALVQEWVRAARGGAPAQEPLTAPGRDLERYTRDVERYTFALGAAMRDLERVLRRPLGPVLAEGVREAEVVIVSAGASARAARQALPYLLARGGRPVGVLQVASLRPFPAAEIVRLAWRARAVVVHEPMPEPLGTGGILSDALRAAFADALTWHPAFAGIGRIPPVTTVLGPSVATEQWISLAHVVGEAADPPRLLATDGVRGVGGAAEARIEMVMDEAAREDALRLVVDWLARAGASVSALAAEPTRASLALLRGPSARGPANVFLVSAGGPFEPRQLESLPGGTLVVFAGEFPDRVLAEAMRAGASRGVRVGTLGGHGMPVRGVAALAAVVRSLLSSDSALDASFAAAAREMGIADPEALVTEVRSLADSLSAHFG